MESIFYDAAHGALVLALWTLGLMVGIVLMAVGYGLYKGRARQIAFGKSMAAIDAEFPDTLQTETAADEREVPMSEVIDPVPEFRDAAGPAEPAVAAATETKTN